MTGAGPIGLLAALLAMRRGLDLAATALARADLDWLDRLITRRVPLERAGDAFEPHPDDVKVVITLDAR